MCSNRPLLNHLDPLMQEPEFMNTHLAVCQGSICDDMCTSRGLYPRGGGEVVVVVVVVVAVVVVVVVVVGVVGVVVVV